MKIWVDSDGTRLGRAYTSAGRTAHLHQPGAPTTLCGCQVAVMPSSLQGKRPRCQACRGLAHAERMATR